ncbi:SDR family oxidoreductase [Citrobacter koseri]|uniref:SDR family oxidoreductase n=1 Tax=Citrobacter koseri TaxID=545 RepID=UPI0023AEA987|nr:SDR family oxidoreductase [Citrobacter koseri]
MKYELQQMRRQRSCEIVNCSSLSGLVGITGRGVYHATKHGVLGLTKIAALEYAAREILINAVCPGIIRTPIAEDMLNNEPEAMEELMKLQPIGRLGEAEEVAHVVLRLCSSDACLVTGQALTVDGGYTIIDILRVLSLIVN